MEPEPPAAALAELFRAHQTAVLRACRAYLRNDTEAEDATQETYLAAHRSLLRGTTPDHPQAWLLAIARNVCWGRLQRQPSDPLPLNEAKERPDERSDTVAAVVRADAGGALWRAVGDLPSRQQDAFMLCEVAGEPYAEAAARLEITEPALDALLVRARRRLRTRLHGFAGTFQWVGAVPASWLDRLGATKAAVVTVGAVALGSSTLVTHDATRRTAVSQIHTDHHATAAVVHATRRIAAATPAPAAKPKPVPKPEDASTAQAAVPKRSLAWNSDEHDRTGAGERLGSETRDRSESNRTASRSERDD